MFKCFGFGNNRIVDSSAEPAKWESDYATFKYDKLSVAYVYIGGVGSGYLHHINKICAGNQFFEYVPYGTQGIPKDVIQARRDLKSIAKSPSISTITASARERLTFLVDAIKKYLTNPTIKYVVTIGVSHGSILLHAAVLKLKMNLNLEKSHLDKLCVYTQGSPRYLPLELLPPLPTPTDQKPFARVMNFYHVNDQLIRTLKTLHIPNIIAPDLRKIKKIYEFLKFEVTNCDNDNKPVYYYNKTQGYVVVDNVENLCCEKPIGVQQPPHDHWYDKYNKGYKYHGCIYNAFLAIDFTTLYRLENFTIRLKLCNIPAGTSVVPATGTSNGGKIQLKKTSIVKEILGRKRIIYKIGNKQYVKVKGNFIPVSTLLIHQKRTQK